MRLIQSYSFEDDTLKSTTLYTYDSTKGKKKEKVEIEYDVTIFLKLIYKRDSLGRIISCETESGNELYKYDNSGRLIETRSKNAIAKYNKNGLKSEAIWFSQEGDTTDLATYSYNSINKIDEQLIKRFKDSSETKYRFFYDKRNRVIKKIITENGTQEVLEYKYDSNDNLIEAKDSEDADVTTYRYKVDEKANWIERTKFVNGKAEEITERQILYY